MYKHVDFESIIYKIESFRNKFGFRFIVYISYECYVNLGMKPFTITFKLNKY